MGMIQLGGIPTMSKTTKALVAALTLTGVSLSLVANAPAAGSSGFPHPYDQKQVRRETVPVVDGQRHSSTPRATEFSSSSRQRSPRR